MSVATFAPTAPAAAGAVGRHRSAASRRTAATTGGSRATVSGLLRSGGRLAVGASLLLAIVMFAFLALGPHVLGYRTATMLTGSMEPSISPGDVVVSVPVAAEDVVVGDVISYHIPVEDRRVETHRVVEVGRSESGATTVVTQGDANPNVDPWTATLDGGTAWRTAYVVPHLGSVIRAMRAPMVQGVLFWGALAGLMALGLAMIWRDERDERGEREGRGGRRRTGGSRESFPADPGGPTIDPTTGPGLPVDPQSGGGMARETSGGETDPRYLDHAALGKLASDMEDESFARAFARRYQQLLERRVTRIGDALAAADVEKAMDALLSLKVSSTTAGTRELARLAADIEDDVRRMDLGSARRRAGGLREAADRADAALTNYLAGV